MFKSQLQAIKIQKLGIFRDETLIPSEVNSNAKFNFYYFSVKPQIGIRAFLAKPDEILSFLG